MDVVFLSRLQFAMATMFHFIFVPLTLGLSMLVAIMETIYVKTGDETYKRMAKFWGKLFLINFALGVVTGITLEFQFGTNWSKYSEYVGDIFGSLLAIEATAAFFLESTFIAVWVFGWDKLSPKMHLLSIWLVAVASNLSAIWILIANAFMQHPVGYVMRNGRAELANFWDVVFHKFAWLEILHTITGAYILAGFFVLGVSSYHLLRSNKVDFFKKSFRIAATFALIFSLVEVVEGHFHGSEIAETQPTKLAAMESLWETGSNVPMHLLVVPDEDNEKNSLEAIPIPGLLSFLAYHNPSATVKGLKDFPKEERPPVALTFYSFRIMVGLAFLFLLLSFLAWKNKANPLQSKGLLKALIWAIPLPYIANEAGWIVAEVGRQPWIVYGLMKTSDAVSPVSSGQVWFSFALLTILYTFLGAVDIYLLAKFARKGPEA
ncbi:cytochrome ubiquinol oxidase subunit I [Desulfovulcanus ferrireducens]|uniref:cytochrome ubiquinol oxidase subunit I n=1 Tax=Desulfovulcanus ferrireducens TaxID=2831190 RepID=UPI0025A4AC4B|nr:cytochrome ubiquinol oxidase subunit I [Desulfovulcanus ferrireducens]